MADKEANTSPITFRFADIDRATRDAFEHYCNTRLAEANAAREAEHTKQRVEENRHSEAEAARRQQENAAEPRLIVERAQAVADARKIQRAAEFEDAKQELEILKLRHAAESADMEAKTRVFEKVADIAWPKLEAFGSGLVGMVREENAAIRDLLVANMHLLAGRNPQDGTK